MSSTSQPSNARRRFLIQCAVITALPLAAQVAPAIAQDKLPRLPPTNPQGVALKYVEDASAIKDSTHQPGSNCANCQFHTDGTDACTLFAGFSVSPQGWCSAWAKKA